MVEQAYVERTKKPCLMMTSPGSMERLLMASMQNFRADVANEENKKCSCKFSYARVDQTKKLNTMHMKACHEVQTFKPISCVLIFIRIIEAQYLQGGLNCF